VKKLIKEVDEKRGIVQVTIADERWYMKSQENPATKLPEFKAVPSVTWIAGHYPKGIGYYKWLGEHGWDESQALMREAGDKGSIVHDAISKILGGEEVRIDSKFINKSTEHEQELSFEEVECVKAFCDWRASLESFEPIAWDLTVFSDKHNYAGSIDLIARVNGALYIIDFKTSQQVWVSHEMQVSAYRETVENGENPLMFKGKQVNVAGLKTAILQIGYQRNKNRHKWTEIENCFDLFLNAKAIWKREAGEQTPRKVDLPIVLSPAIKVEEVLAAQETKDESQPRNPVKSRTAAKAAARN
jgi:hypothetical protein